jgi:hypothetical protein
VPPHQSHEGNRRAQGYANPGYLMRGMHLLPKRGDKPEWQHTQDYWTEKDTFPATDLDDAVFVYE